MIDFSDPEFLADPYPTLNAVREETPIFTTGTAKGHGQQVTFLTRWDDVNRVQRDRRFGRVLDSMITREEMGLKWGFDWEPYFAVEEWSLLMLEPPEHTRIRGLVQKEFTPRRVEALRPLCRALADRFLDECLERGDFDLLADFAQPYSVHVITGLLGAPSSDWRQLLEWSHQIVKMYELDTTEDEARAAVVAAADFATWCRALMADRRAYPTDDLISGLVTVETEEGRLSDAEIVSTIILLLNAGHEATVNTMGNGVTALLDRRDEWQRLVAGEVAAATAIEEMMRFDSPLQLFERWVLDPEGVEVAGRSLQQGDKIAMLFGAANRDPRHFPDPDRFDAARGDRTHITFGAGTHHCLGAPLARVELDEALAALVARAPDLEFAAVPTRAEAFVIHGYESVLVTT